MDRETRESYLLARFMGFYNDLRRYSERCRSGRSGRSRKQVWWFVSFVKKRRKSLENKAFTHFPALPFAPPKRP
jgi:hypothetical protein